MSTKTLSYTTIQAGEARNIDFPLHPQTVSENQVGKLLTDLLDTITRQIGDQSPVSDGDVLQSLCMALAIRMNMINAPSGAVRRLVSTLLEKSDEAVTGSTARPAGNA